MAERGTAGTRNMRVMVLTTPERPCSFKVIRRNDETGISGNGRVAEGVVFSTGKVCVQWLSDAACVQTWDRLEDFLNVHVNSHPSNRTILVWSDGSVWEHQDG